MGGISMKHPLGGSGSFANKALQTGKNNFESSTGIRDISMQHPLGHDSSLGSDFLRNYPGFQLVRAGANEVGLGKGMGEFGDPKYDVEQKMRAEQERASNLAGLQARQQAMAQGVGGGGVQVGMENGAYNQVAGQYEQQIQQAHMQQQQQAIQNLAIMMQLLGLFA